METLDGSSWDIVIVGTDLQQSLLALALSRSGLKVLHIDNNEYYGGLNAALSLQEAESWAERVSKGMSGLYIRRLTPRITYSSDSSPFFRNAAISRCDPNESPSSSSRLSFPRAYSLALSPDLIYSLSTLLPVLISSKVYRQLEFLAIGSWWVHSTVQPKVDPAYTAAQTETSERNVAGKLAKVPNGREDVFANKSVDVRAKRQLMKFLRFAVRYDDEDQVATWEPHRSEPLLKFLSDQFNIPPTLQQSLLALTLSQYGSSETSTGFALPRIARHLRSIGVFGPGFGSLTPKWGGLAEVAQVACRAGAVGGGVYVLDKIITSIEHNPTLPDGNDPTPEPSKLYKLRLSGGDVVDTNYIVGLQGTIPPLPYSPSSGLFSQDEPSRSSISRIISIISSPLTSLFPSVSESGPLPAGAVIIFPSGSLEARNTGFTGMACPPVHVFVHSSETGECPSGQCVVYASTALAGEPGFSLLDRAMSQLLHLVDERPSPFVLWSMRYEQCGKKVAESAQDPQMEAEALERDTNLICFPPPSLDLVFDDRMIDRVKAVWQKIMGQDAQGFMTFEDKEGMGEISENYE